MRFNLKYSNNYEKLKLTVLIVQSNMTTIDKYYRKMNSVFIDFAVNEFGSDFETDSTKLSSFYCILINIAN